MAQFDGHVAKRRRTDNYGERESFNVGGNFFNNNNFGNWNTGGGRAGFEENPNHILLITVMNPTYPITMDIIHTICSTSGKVLRIIMFTNNGVQAMVEFDSLETAERTKQSLNGCNIYSGCCTLKIEFAKPTRLNVYKNDNESWDYTINALGGRGPQPPYEGGYVDGYMPRGPRPEPYRPPHDPYGGQPAQEREHIPNRMTYSRPHGV